MEDKECVTSCMHTNAKYKEVRADTEKRDCLKFWSPKALPAANTS